MTLVIDASVSVKWVVDEPLSDIARTLSPNNWAAPESWLSECGNALWKKARRGELDPADAKAGFTALMRTPMRLIPIAALIDRAWELAARIEHPVHDCLHLACALAEDCEMITADTVFVRAAARRPDLAPRVRLLGA